MNYKKFAETNSVWNQGGFNHSAVVGSVMALAKELSPTSAEDFEEKYYLSGEEREIIINKMSENKIKDLNDINFLRSNNSNLSALTENEKELMFKKGRSKNYIDKVVDEFASYAGITKSESRSYVRTRLFKETFEGYQEEIKAREILEKLYPNFKVVSSSAEHDSNYAIDLEFWYKEKLVAGVQVKPRSYAQFKNDVTKSTIRLNKEKNEKFKKKFKAPVLWYYYDNKGKKTLRGFDDKSNYLLNQLLRDAS